MPCVCTYSLQMRSGYNTCDYWVQRLEWASKLRGLTVLPFPENVYQLLPYTTVHITGDDHLGKPLPVSPQYLWSRITY